MLFGLAVLNTRDLSYPQNECELIDRMSYEWHYFNYTVLWEHVNTRRNSALQTKTGRCLMGQMTMQTLQSFFVAPEKYQFMLLIDDTKGEKRFGFSIHRDDEVVRIMEPFTRNPEHVYIVLKDFLDTSLKIGRLNRKTIVGDNSQIEKTLEGFRNSINLENNPPCVVVHFEPKPQYEVAA